MIFHLPFPIHTDDKDDQEQYGCDQLHAGRVQTTGNGDGHTGFVDDRSHKYRCGCPHDGKIFEKIGSDDDTGQADDHRTGTHGNVKETFLMSIDGAAQGYQTVGDGQTDDLDQPLILCQAGDQCVIVSHCPEQIAGTGF